MEPQFSIRCVEVSEEEDTGMKCVTFPIYVYALSTKLFYVNTYQVIPSGVLFEVSLQYGKRSQQFKQDYQPAQHALIS